MNNEETVRLLRDAARELRDLISEKNARTNGDGQEDHSFEACFELFILAENIESGRVSGEIKPSM
jgi:hypothetical protein